MGAIKEHYHEEILKGQIEVNEKHAYDWGRFEYQKELLNKLDEWENELADEDTEGHLRLHVFKSFVKSVKP